MWIKRSHTIQWLSFFNFVIYVCHSVVYVTATFLNTKDSIYSVIIVLQSHQVDSWYIFFSSAIFKTFLKNNFDSFSKKK